MHTATTVSRRQPLTVLQMCSVMQGECGVDDQQDAAAVEGLGQRQWRLTQPATHRRSN